MTRWWFALVLAGCTPAPAAPVAPAEAPLLTIREDAFGPLTAQSLATLGALRAAFPGYEVAAVNHDGVEYRVSEDGTKLFDIVPDATGHVLNVHVVTPKIDVQGSPWRVGGSFRELDRVTTCECWADQPVCFHDGAHVAIAFAKVCREGSLGSPAARQALVDSPIHVVIWSARALAPGGYRD